MLESIALCNLSTCNKEEFEDLPEALHDHPNLRELRKERFCPIFDVAKIDRSDALMELVKRKHSLVSVEHDDEITTFDQEFLQNKNCHECWALNRHRARFEALHDDTQSTPALLPAAFRNHSVEQLLIP